MKASTFFIHPRTVVKEIRNIIAHYDRHKHAGSKMALASVVHVEASAYRRVGARMLVDSQGNWVGGISGGCLEGDVLRRSQKAIFNQEASIVIYDTMEDDSNQLGVGLGCNGLIKVLFHPIDSKDPQNPIEVLRLVSEQREACLLLKVVNSSNSAFTLGQTLLVDAPFDLGSFWGIPQENWKPLLKEVLETRRPTVFSIKHENVCLEVLVEYIRPEIDLIVIGDNKDVVPVLNIAHELGWNTQVVGRKRKMIKEIVQRTQAIFDYTSIESLHLHAYSPIIVMTHDFERDKSILPFLLNSSSPYIGLLGPKKRTEKLNEALALEKSPNFKALHGPTGLDIGAESPEEIALSIIAEVIASFRRRKGGYLRNRKKPIHKD